MAAKYALILSVILCSFQGIGQILTFEFSSLSGNEPVAASSFNDSNLLSSSISRGSGLVASPNAGRFNATEWTTSSTIDLNEFMEFTITPTGGYQFSVSSIYVQIRRSGTGPREIALRSSLDGYSTNLDTNYIILDNTNTQNYTFTFSQPNSSVAITYRIYMYNAESNLGSSGIGDGAGNDIEVYGTVSFPTNCTTIFEDDFSMGLGSWLNTGDWTTSSGELQHNVITGMAGDSYIYADLGIQNLNAGDYEWQFCMRNGNWDPSSNNNFTYYLITDSPNYLDVNTVNGYTVGVNRTGTAATDELVLYEVTNGNHNIIRSTLFDWDNNDDVCVRITRNTTGLWEIFYNPNGMGEISVGTVTNNNHATGRYTGVFFEHTASNGNELWVDDVSICNNLVTVGPELQIVAVGANESCGYTLDFGNIESNNAFLDLGITIENVGSANLDLSSLTITGTDASEFSFITSIPPPDITITPGNSQEIILRFTPTSTAAKTAVLTAGSNDSDESSCNINLVGNGIVNSGTGPLMISQYYEGINTNKWIEITNISSSTVNASLYYLAAYNQYNSCFKEPLNGPPTSSIQLPNINMASGDVILLKEPTATVPGYATATVNMFPASFSGDDIIVISTTNDASCYNNRIDIIGEYSSPCGTTYWGREKSYVRNQCISYGTDITFDPNHWIIYDYNDIEVATISGDGSNAYLGQHAYTVTYTGARIFNGWEQGYPSEYRHARINGAYTTGSFNACNLTVLPVGSLDVIDNTYVRVINDVSNQGIITVQTKGAFVQDGNGSSAGSFTNSGTANVIKQTSDFFDDGYNYHYTYWSSPVLNADITTVFPNPRGNRRFYFDTNQYIDTNGDDISDTPNDWQPATGNMEVGRGYAVTATSPPPVPSPFPYNNIHQFSGEFNTGDITKSIVVNSHVGDNDWNFIGNPYPSAIDFDALYNSNTTLIDGAMFLWSQASPPDSNNPGNQPLNFNQSDYAIYTVGSGGVAGASGIIPTQYIPSGQGFFVKGISGGMLTFNNGMRMADTSSNDIFYEANTGNHNGGHPNHRLWLNLTSDNGVFSQVLIAYVDGATDDKDSWSYDAPRNMSIETHSSLYSLIDDKVDKFAIQGKSPESLNTNEIVQIGFKTSIEVPTLYKISIAQKEGWFFNNQDIFLRDNLLNVLHDLKLTDYLFTSEIGAFNERFEILFTRDILNLNETAVSGDALYITELNNGYVKFKLNGFCDLCVVLVHTKSSSWQTRLNLLSFTLMCSPNLPL